MSNHLDHRLTIPAPNPYILYHANHDTENKHNKPPEVQEDEYGTGLAELKKHDPDTYRLVIYSWA